MSNIHYGIGCDKCGMIFSSNHPTDNRTPPHNCKPKVDRLAIELEMQALISERQGYITCNQERVSNGNSVGYDELTFDELASQFRALAEKLQ